MKVPEKAVHVAIKHGNLSSYTQINPDTQLTEIAIDALAEYKFELIGAYEYAQRRGVSWRAVYNKLDKGIIEYSTEEKTNSEIMKIDWLLFKDVPFRTVTFKHRGKGRILNVDKNAN